MIDRGDGEGRDLTPDDTLVRLTPACWHFKMRGDVEADLFWGVRMGDEVDTWGKMTIRSPIGLGAIYLFPDEVLDIHLTTSDPYPENSAHYS